MKSRSGFLQLLNLGTRLRRKGWVPLTLHSSSPSLRLRFRAGGLDWHLSMNPSVMGSTALLNLWVVPGKPLPKSNAAGFPKALDRQMARLRFLKVFGLETGGRILYYKRLSRYREIAATWNRIVAVDFTTLEHRKIPASPPVRSPIGRVGERLRHRLFDQLVKRMRSNHVRFGVTRKERVAGHRWWIHYAISWDPLGRFQCSLMITPPEGTPRKDRRELEKAGFHSRVARSLRRRGFRGNWWDVWNGFADFNRGRLRWNDVVRLPGLLDPWSLGTALAEFPDDGLRERILRVKRTK